MISLFTNYKLPRNKCK